VPVVAFTLSPIVARRLAVRRGVTPIVLSAQAKSGTLLERMEQAWRTQHGSEVYESVLLVTTSQETAGINRLEFQSLPSAAPAAPPRTAPAARAAQPPRPRREAPAAAPPAGQVPEPGPPTSESGPEPTVAVHEAETAEPDPPTAAPQPEAQSEPKEAQTEEAARA
jgi:hypothetical protein